MLLSSSAGRWKTSNGGEKAPAFENISTEAAPEEL